MGPQPTLVTAVVTAQPAPVVQRPLVHQQVPFQPPNISVPSNEPIPTAMQPPPSYSESEAYAKQQNYNPNY